MRLPLRRSLTLVRDFLELPFIHNENFGKIMAITKIGFLISQKTPTITTQVMKVLFVCISIAILIVHALVI